MTIGNIFFWIGVAILVVALLANKEQVWLGIPVIIAGWFVIEVSYRGRIKSQLKGFQQARDIDLSVRHH